MSTCFFPGRSCNTTVLQAPEGWRRGFAQTAAPSGTGVRCTRAVFFVVQVLKRGEKRWKGRVRRFFFFFFKKQPPSPRACLQSCALHYFERNIYSDDRHEFSFFSFPLSNKKKKNTSLLNECIHGCLVSSSTRLLCFNEQSRYPLFDDDSLAWKKATKKERFTPLMF